MTSRARGFASAFIALGVGLYPGGAAAAASGAGGGLRVAGVGGLDSVACARPNACVAAGFAAVNFPGMGSPVVVAISSARGPGLPVGTGNLLLAGVACYSSSHCVAVGTTNDKALSGPHLGEMARLRVAPGTVHLEVTAPTNLAELVAVSCPAARACVAVGAKPPAKPGGVGVPAALAFDPESLKPGRESTLAGFSNLSAVACTGPASCLVVGAPASGGSAFVAASYDPASGARGPTHPLAGKAYANSLECEPSAVKCAVVSDPLDNGAGTVRALLQYLPVATAVPSAPKVLVSAPATVPGAKVPGAAGPHYGALACASATKCLAGGNSAGLEPKRGYTSATAAEVSPIVAGQPSSAVTLSLVGADDAITAMACPSASKCLAVGTTAKYGGPGEPTRAIAFALAPSGTELKFG